MSGHHARVRFEGSARSDSPDGVCALEAAGCGARLGWCRFGLAASAKAPGSDFPPQDTERGPRAEQTAEPQLAPAKRAFQGSRRRPAPRRCCGRHPTAARQAMAPSPAEGRQGWGGGRRARWTARRCFAFPRLMPPARSTLSDVFFPLPSWCSVPQARVGLAERGGGEALCSEPGGNWCGSFFADGSKSRGMISAFSS